jgi:hypothetical protein
MTPRRTILLILLLVVGGFFCTGCGNQGFGARRRSPVIQPTQSTPMQDPGGHPDQATQGLTVLKDRRERPSPIIQPLAERSQ